MRERKRIKEALLPTAMPILVGVVREPGDVVGEDEEEDEGPWVCSGDEGCVDCGGGRVMLFRSRRLYGPLHQHSILHMRY